MRCAVAMSSSKAQAVDNPFGPTRFSTKQLGSIISVSHCNPAMTTLAIGEREAKHPSDDTVAKVWPDRVTGDETLVADLACDAQVCLSV